MVKHTLFRTFMALSSGVCLLSGTGCAVSQSFAKSMVDTQKVVSYKAEDYADPVKIVGEHAIVYSPAAHSGRADDSLLAQFAPVIVQEIEAPNHVDYPKDSDEIGSPELAIAEGSGYRVNINTHAPVLYTSIETTRVYGADMKQLVYVFWYPRHPVGLVEKGDIDGGVLRITLDAANRPAIYEFVGACGCFHGVFIGDHIESQAQQEYKTLVQSKKRYVERDVENIDDWRVRDLVLGSDHAQRPVLFMSAGKHQCLAIQTTDRAHNLKRYAAQDYAMKDYAALEQIPVLNGAQGATGSMFNDKGLIWGGQRKGEEKMFTKLDHGGWPRRLSAMKIHWDQESWNDKDLLEKFLRLPHSMTRDVDFPAKKS